tara:strand:- start:322 stop:498 length:177 start_codon:yes stop_codon:yes gene_type:complete
MKLTKAQKVEIIKATELYTECLDEVECSIEDKRKSILDFIERYTNFICGIPKEPKNIL